MSDGLKMIWLVLLGSSATAIAIAVMKLLEVYPELFNPFILNDCIADCIAIVLQAT